MVEGVIIWIGHTTQTGGSAKKKGKAKFWKMLYLGEDGRLHSRYLSWFQAHWLRHKVQKLRTYTCLVCGFKYQSNIERCRKCQP
jgi:hypothetical protein